MLAMIITSPVLEVWVCADPQVQAMIITGNEVTGYTNNFIARKTQHQWGSNPCFPRIVGAS